MEQTSSKEAPPATGAGAPGESDIRARAEQSSDAGKLLKTPEALSAERHGALRIERRKNAFGFARGMHLVPITIEEFAPASSNFPIIFAGEAKSPCVVMSVERDQNMFIDDTGVFEEGCYIPAFLRQHPFLMAKDSKSESNVLLIDAASDAISETVGEALFEDGKPTQYTTGVYGFLVRLQKDWARTKEMIDHLNANDLFERRNVTIRRGPNDGPVSQPFRFFSISSEKIDALDGDALKALAQPGWLQAIYAQQASMYAWTRLQMRARAAEVKAA